MAATMRDVRLLLWLRARHARSTLDRALHLAGAGVDGGGRGERAYQLYVAGVMAVWFALMAAALIDAIQGAFAGVGIAVCALAVQGALLVPVLVLLCGGIAGVRTAPLKLSHPDIAYLAASAVSARPQERRRSRLRPPGARPGSCWAWGLRARPCSRPRRARWRSRARRWRLPQRRSGGSRDSFGWLARAGPGGARPLRRWRSPPSPPRGAASC